MKQLEEMRRRAESIVKCKDTMPFSLFEQAQDCLRLISALEIALSQEYSYKETLKRIEAKLRGDDEV